MTIAFPVDDQDDVYARLRRDHPLCRVRMPHGGNAWLVTRAEDVRAVLADSRLSREMRHDVPDVPRMSPQRSVFTDDSILGMDPPRQTRLRRLTASAFSTRRVARLRPRAEAITAELLDAFEDPHDVVSGLAQPLPLMMICEILGVPVRDRERFQRWAQLQVSITSDPPEVIGAALADLRDYVRGLIAERRVRDHDDLLADLVSARDDGDRLSEDELVTLAVTLLVGGLESTASAIALSVHALLSHPDQLALVRDQPGLLPAAVEELLRYIPMGVGAGVPKFAAEPVEIAGGVIAEGDAVFASIRSANLDERVFARPERLDVTRRAGPHVAFGHGAHYCMGAQLARLEMTTALGMLLRRFPAMRPAEVSWLDGFTIRRPDLLSITW